MRLVTAAGQPAVRLSHFFEDDAMQDSPEADHSPEHHRPALGDPKRLFKWGLGAAGVIAIAVAVYLTVLVVTTPGVADLKQASSARPSVILSSDGELIGRFASAYQSPIALKDVAPVVVQALVATEDHRFYDHTGWTCGASSARPGKRCRAMCRGRRR